MSSSGGGRSGRDEKEEEDSSSSSMIGMAGAAAAGVAFLAWGISKLMSSPEENKPLTPNHTPITSIPTRSYQYSESYNHTPNRVPETITLIPQRWEKPPRGCYKLNFDGSDRHQLNSAGAGCIIRNYSGSVVIAAAYGLNRENVSFAEAEALKRGIQLAKELNIRVLYIEGDSEEIISRVNGAIPMKSCSMSRMDYLITAIKVEKERSFDYSEIKRVDGVAANDVADKLAYWGARFLKPGQEKIWDQELPHSLPPHVIDAVDKDRRRAYSS